MVIHATLVWTNLFSRHHIYESTLHLNFCAVFISWILDFFHTSPSSTACCTRSIYQTQTNELSPATRATTMTIFEKTWNQLSRTHSITINCTSLIYTSLSRRREKWRVKFSTSQPFSIVCSRYKWAVISRSSLRAAASTLIIGSSTHQRRVQLNYFSDFPRGQNMCKESTVMSQATERGGGHYSNWRFTTTHRSQSAPTSNEDTSNRKKLV